MAATSTTPDLELPLRLERNGTPLHEQIAQQLRRAIRQGLLRPGARLPSTRSVAKTLGISRNLVVQAYEELFSEGYLMGRTGSGTYVEQSLPDVWRPLPPVSTRPPGLPRWLHSPERTARAESPGGSPEPGTIALLPGTPATEPFPQEVWQRVWKRVGHERPPKSYGALSGDPQLRQELAAYLGRARGIACASEDIIVTSGTAQALRLLALAALQPGDRIGFEEPGYPTARQVFRAYGALLVPVPVDDDGLQVDALPLEAEAPLMVYVTPSHQCPLGSRLSIARRLALLEWAHTSDSLVIEDDYDSEFRYDAPPLSALAGLDHSGRVAYVGTFSKVLTPTLRLGYLLAPPPLREAIDQLKQRACLSNYYASWPVQRALALLLAEGHLERHIRRMRRHYAAKRALVGTILAPLSPLACLQGLEAGLHAYLALHPALDPQRIITRARERKVLVPALDSFYLGTPDRNGLLLGYGGVSFEELRRGVQILAEVIAEQASQKE
jgi:GntR family transcriptional regulator / MocR family aminotransferase